MTPARAHRRSGYWIIACLVSVLARVAFELTIGDDPSADLFEPVLLFAHAVTVGMTMRYVGWVQGYSQGRLDGLRDGRGSS